ncbi:hypothetical protein [Streptomyces sp. NPDC091027]|uniref:hypothetical protein n=1 Tax=Streptomyces sp. NPDC091027 TaxID=3365971 RepID=UPI0037F6C501
MGEFDLFVGAMPTSSLSYGELLSTLEGILPTTAVEADPHPGAVQLRSDAALLRVFDNADESEGDTSLFAMIPWMISIRLLEVCDLWSDSLQLARFIYSALSHRTDAYLMLVHDDEELVDSNFTHEEIGDLRDFHYW